ncbi:AAA family ATPase [Ligilactobacillus salivarius]|uniref:ATP-binding protein n=1 Tax=Ligilactobacillus salivarius TaxID=1624 RepID=UPI000A2E652D|nr:ATP-binding protein [Ligilactobacillus salivarius]OTF89101.1 AAA family ATPase [Ligilactobacillus salivarius]PAY42678.1 AAA family ATPase [Ligilactobacillus salivarius]PAY48530.1 AAA family ATPase [Ligilactobacillus salivarius]PAY56966.1 AAA family ATPase [Ligilactobacillus salivarius]PAY61380.1 AAA family ATPase [Ligilactobacillus salivarius]
MKKADVLDLIKYHFEDNKLEFKNQAIKIARDFDNNGDSQLAQYIMGMMTQVNRFSPQDTTLENNLVQVKLDSKPLPLPTPILDDIKGIINAVNHNIGINKFLFVGSPGTGKTESAKQVARLLNRGLLIVDFSNLIDSKLGQTNKNLTKLFKEINELPLLERYIILFDEIDAIALDRINQNDVREMGRVTSTFLRKMDTLNPEVVLIATTNLFANFDKALIRRFDAVIDFDRYSDDDKVEVAKIILNNYLKQFKDVKKDIRLFKKIIKSAKKIPNPGDLRNIIRVSLAFSDPNDPNDYLKRLMKNMHNGRIPSISNLYKNGFTVREIETLTGISKSTVSRELGDQKYE